MSTMPSSFQPPTGPADDSRLELAMAAMRRERRNRPRALPMLALVVLAVAVASLIWTFSVRAAAATRLSRASSSLANIQGVVSQLDAMETQRNDPKYNPEIDMVGKLQRFAAQLELPRVEVRQTNPTTSVNVKGFTKRVYVTVIPDTDPALLLRWVAESTNGVNFPGLEVEMLKLTPGRTLENDTVGWTLDIAFRRWERTQ
jgi:hypothetical protein